MNNFSEIQVFNFSEAEIRIILTPTGDVYFVASDVCKVLELANVGQAMSRLDDDERSSFEMTTLGGKQEMAIITESGLYSLVLSSRKPEAKTFKKWVTSEVLPAIRKTGTYSVSNVSIGLTKTDILDMMNDYMTKKQIEKRIENLVHDVNKGIEASLTQFYEGLNQCYFNDIEERLEKLEELNFPALGTATAFVYITQEGDTDIYKIGQSTQPDIRTEKLNTGNSQHLTIIKKIPFLHTKESATFEKHLQIIFLPKQIKGEWYKLNAQDLQMIDQLAYIYSKRVKENI